MAALDVNPKYNDTDDVRTPPIHIQGGQQVVSAAFIKRFDGPVYLRAWSAGFRFR